MTTDKVVQAIEEDLRGLREALRHISSFLALDASGFHAVPEIERLLDPIRAVQDEMTPQGGRSGNVDVPVGQILTALKLGSITEKPEILSAVGVLVDSRTALGVLQVRDDFERKLASSHHGLGYELFVGYRPHADAIRSLPRSFFEHPRYYAPIEDFLDWIAEDFYAGKRAGESEDGSVGWLIAEAFLGDGKTRHLEELADATLYWTSQRLQECLETWNTVVRPALEE